ncbi:hypothetical protein HY950_00890, partial [Candidatus Gottesmanbacteria bacterium]|nr:hypothetical protein [Candidatus Gottesmanbacteria bacterium]
MRVRFAILLAKLTSLLIKILGLGAGATWPGEIALTLAPNVLTSFVPRLTKGVILVAGTNGKTTTSLMIKTILEKQGYSVVHNASGANLLNGVVSACIQQASWDGKLNADYGVFEIDENSLPIVLKECHSDPRAGIQVNTKTGSRVPPFRRARKPGMTTLTVVLLNLFRDQLDRYGEVDVIAEKWERALREQ